VETKTREIRITKAKERKKKKEENDGIKEDGKRMEDL